METKIAAETKDLNIAGKEANGSPYGDTEKNDIPIQELVTSESKTPLKTPVKDGDEANQVKFVTTESPTEINGDAKIDIDHSKDCFSGMSKEELLQYVNDPFWVKMRLTLFILFWVAWVALLVGAIAIIVAAPKCETGLLYELEGPILEMTPSSDSSSVGLLTKFTEKLNSFRDLHIKGLILSPISKTNNLRFSSEDVIDFKAIDEKYGTEEDLKEFVKEAKSKDMKVLISFVPNHSSDKHAWFNKSVAKEEPYDDYYIWAPSSGTDSDGSRMPPNNWLSVTGGSAWEWNEDRQEYYLHQFDVSQPDLNFRNPKVVQEFNETFHYFLGLGVDGFNLRKTQYLLEDKDLQDEQISRGTMGVYHTDYNFYYHHRTYNLPETANLLSQWREAIHQKTDGKGILMITGDPPIPSESNETTTSVDIARNDKLFSGLPRDFTVSDLYPRLEKVVQSADKWPVYDVGDPSIVMNKQFTEDDSDGLKIVTLLLKGVPIVFSGDEAGLQGAGDASSGDEDGRFKIFKALMKARESKAIIYGTSNLTVLNDSVVTLTRIKAGNPGYLAAFNLSPVNVTVDFTSLEYIPKELVVYTSGLSFPRDPTTDKIKANAVGMTARSSVVFTFAPDIGEGN